MPFGKEHTPVRNGKALVVLSGGQDSTTCLFLARQKYAELCAITFDYKQRHICEVQAASKAAQLAGVVQHVVLPVGDLLCSTSPLVDKSGVLETYTDFNNMASTIGDRVELTFVPMRNAFFLVLAANWAIHFGCRTLVTGVCQEDNANYPDCRESFIAAQQAAINEALGINDFVIDAPLLHFSKAETVRAAQAVPGCMEALAYSHTCYAGEYPPCGKCHACVLRAHGFEQAGIADPLVERAKHVRAE